jgi:hypothetical protein
MERRAKDVGREGRFALRTRLAVPVLEHFKEYLERERLRVLPKSPEGMALACALSNWAALRRYPHASASIFPTKASLLHRFQLPDSRV